MLSAFGVAGRPFAVAVVLVDTAAVARTAGPFFGGPAAMLALLDCSRLELVKRLRAPHLDTPPKPPRLTRSRRHRLQLAYDMAGVGADKPKQQLPTETPEALDARAQQSAEELTRPWNRCGSLSVTPAFTVAEQTMNSSRLMRLLADRESGGLIFNRMVGRPGLTPEVTAPTLGPDAERMRGTPNAGGNSVWSEVLSYETMRVAYGAKLLRTETEIRYACDSKITDYAMRLRGRNIGVSVTRVINFSDLAEHKHQAPFSRADVRHLLEKKLYGVIASTAQVTDADRWEKQVLHVFTTSQAVSRAVIEEYWHVRPDLRSDTVVMVTECSNFDWIFC